MSIEHSNSDAKKYSTVSSEAADNTPDKRNRSCTYWVRDDDRQFITDPNGEVVNLARLTAYAEYGEAIHDAQAHHEIPKLKIDAPAFLDVVTQREHGQFHRRDPDPVEVDGIPRLQIEQ